MSSFTFACWDELQKARMQIFAVFANALIGLTYGTPWAGWKTFHSNRKMLFGFICQKWAIAWHRHRWHPSAHELSKISGCWPNCFFNLEATLLNVLMGVMGPFGCFGCGDRWSQIISASFGCQQHQLLNSQEQSVILCPKLSNWVCLYHLSRLSAWICSSSLLIPGEMRLQLLTCLGLGSTGSLGSTGRPPGRVGPGRRQQVLLLLLLLMGFTSSGRPPGATEEHTIRYNGDVNIGQCCLQPFHCLSLTFTFPADLYNRDVNRGGAIFTDLSPLG